MGRKGSLLPGETWQHAGYTGNPGRETGLSGQESAEAIVTGSGR